MKPKTVSELMHITNRWADGEESLQNEHPRSPEDNAFDGGDPFGSGRRSGADRRRKRKHRGISETDGAELVAAEFTGNRDGGYRKQGHEWQQRKGRDDGRPARSAAQQLSDPCTFHTYKDENGNIKSSHLLKDCRRFKDLQEAYGRIQQDATNTGYPVTPGAIAVNPPPPPLTGANLTAVVQPQAYPPSLGNICMTQKGRPSNRSQKLIT